LVINTQNHVPAVTAVTAVGAAERLEFFSTYRDTSVASVTTGYMQDHAVHEFCHGCSPSGKFLVRTSLKYTRLLELGEERILK